MKGMYCYQFKLRVFGLLLAVFSASLSSCKSNPVQMNQQLSIPKIEVSESHGFKTLTLGIAKEVPVNLSEGVVARAFAVAGMHDNQVVEFALVMQDDWEIDSPTETRPFALWWSAMSLERTSVGSDRFARLIEGVFEKPLTGRPFRNVVPFKVVSLGKNPYDFRTQKISMKAFFGEFQRLPESEIYINIDFPHKKVEISEKDLSYRDDLLRALLQEQ